MVTIIILIVPDNNPSSNNSPNINSNHDNNFNSPCSNTHSNLTSNPNSCFSNSNNYGNNFIYPSYNFSPIILLLVQLVFSNNS